MTHPLRAGTHELAFYLGMTERGLELYRKGKDKREPTLQQLVDLADFYEISTDQVIGRE